METEMNTEMNLLEIENIFDNKKFNKKSLTIE